jgi:hypothetical protein
MHTQDFDAQLLRSTLQEPHWDTAKAEQQQFCVAYLVGDHFKRIINIHCILCCSETRAYSIESIINFTSARAQLYRRPSGIACTVHQKKILKNLFSGMFTYRPIGSLLATPPQAQSHKTSPPTGNQETSSTEHNEACKHPEEDAVQL